VFCGGSDVSAGPVGAPLASQRFKQSEICCWQGVPTLTHADTQRISVSAMPSKAARMGIRREYGMKGMG
jgi:hypothetical protein